MLEVGQPIFFSHAMCEANIVDSLEQNKHTWSNHLDIRLFFSNLEFSKLAGILSYY